MTRKIDITLSLRPGFDRLLHKVYFQGATTSGPVVRGVTTPLRNRLASGRLPSATPRPNRPILSGTDPSRSIRPGADNEARKPTVSSRHIPGRSSAWSGSATLASAPTCPPPDGDARSARSWSSTTFRPMRCRGRPPLPTSPFAVGATTNTRPSWSSVRIARRGNTRRSPTVQVHRDPAQPARIVRETRQCFGMAQSRPSRTVDSSRLL